MLAPGRTTQVGRKLLKIQLEKSMLFVLSGSVKGSVVTVRFRSKRDHFRRYCPARDRGAALIEASIGVLTLAILAVGVAEYGTLYSTSISLSHAVRAGVAAGSEAGANPDADVRIIQSLLNSRGTSAGRDVEQVIVFRANGATSSTPPTECTGSSTTPCNAYFFGPSALDGIPEAQISKVVNASKTSEQWPSSSRIPGVDLIGVQVKMRRKAVQSLVWSPNHLSDHHVGLLTPPPQAPSSSPTTEGFIASPFVANPNPDNTALYYGPRDTSAGGGNPGDDSGFGA